MEATQFLRTRRPGMAGAALLATSLGALGLFVAAAPTALADALPSNCTGDATITCTFAYDGTNGADGTPQTWTVPAGVSSAYFDVLGSAGGDSPGDPASGTGGLGGETTGTLLLAPGTTVSVLVGGRGSYSTTTGAGIGGFNGGGGATSTSGHGGVGGGGASDVRVGGTGLGNRLLIAGGGGGSATEFAPPNPSQGGAGGGTVGGNGTGTPADTNGGGGGTQNSGGSAGPGATNGRSGQGGSGDVFGGGGGGGYFGGGGGSSGTANVGGGGGGSGFFSPDTTRVTAGSTAAGIWQGNGLVTLRYSRAAQTITFPALANRSVVESPFTITGVSGGGSGNPVTFTAAGPCSVSGAQVTLSGTGTCTITAHQDGDAGYRPAADVSRSFAVTPKPAVSVGDARTQEGNAGTHPITFQVTMNKAVSAPVTVHWNTVGGSATAPSDFVAASGTVTFTPGQTGRPVSVLVKGDHLKEPNENFSVHLSSPTNATVAHANGVGTIVNDD